MPNKSVSRRKSSTSQKSSNHLMKNVDETLSMPALSKMKVSVIIDSLSQLFPQCSRSELYQHILEIIQVEKNNFCNITNSVIISRAAESVLQSESQKASRENKTKDSSSFHSSCKECLICYTQLAAQHSIRLQCGHMFHDTCVKRWFEEQSTCPTCRRHCLLDEDFPPLI